MMSIDKCLVACSPENDVYTYSFTKEQVDYINKALLPFSVVEEIRQVIKEDNRELIKMIEKLKYDCRYATQIEAYDNVLELLGGSSEQSL